MGAGLDKCVCVLFQELEIGPVTEGSHRNRDEQINW